MRLVRASRVDRVRSSISFPTVALLVGAAVTGAALSTGAVASATPAASDVRVSAGSPAGVPGRNVQAEVSVAIDATQPRIVAAGANDALDGPPCHMQGSCSFVPGVGQSGIYFSLDGGHSWMQPTYRGWADRNGTPQVGAIGTLPWFHEAGLESDGDPALAFGPRPRATRFSWGNGTRLYYATLASNFPGAHTISGFEAVAVSMTDHPRAAAYGDQSAWKRPVIAGESTRPHGLTDKPSLWVDNAASSPHFGTAYACWNAHPSAGAFVQPIVVTHSADGGHSWAAPVKVSPGAAPGITGPLGCGDPHRQQGHRIRVLVYERV
jgi:hypothetical protein